MSNSLRLILARHTDRRAGANALSMPLERKLGDLPRLKYVYADALPLPLERKISEQPASNALYVSLSQPLGTYVPLVYVTASALPLPLSERISNQPSSNVLPLGMTRKLGTLTGSYVPPDSADDSVSVSIVAQAAINPVASASITANDTSVDITVAAVGVLNPVVSAGVSYDANVFRGLIADTSSKSERTALTGTAKHSGFEGTARLTKQAASDAQQSKLIGDDWRVSAEADEALSSSTQLAFEPSKLIGLANTQKAESQRFIGDKSTLCAEASRLIGDDRGVAFEGMVYRRTGLDIKSEQARIVSDQLHTLSEYARLAGLGLASLSEFARLPDQRLRYVPPPIWQTVILKEQVIEGWECGSGDVQRYVYNDELPLVMHRRSVDRPASSALPLTMGSKRGVLTLSAADAEALPVYPCKRKTLGVNNIPDIVLREAPRFGKPSSIAVVTNSTLDAIAALLLQIGAAGSAYNTGVIFVTNSVSLTRSDDGREIKMFDFTVGIDNKSYCWSFSANVPLSELSKVNTAYEQLIGVDFECNGHLWRFILDSCDDSISFGSSSLTIKGKSRAMLLAGPYSEQRGYKYTSQLTARQIAEDELNRGGIASGFALDWQLVSTNGWDVPADTYSYTGRTPINSLQWIAEAAGGFINAHMSDDVISMLHDYPTPSWEWSNQTPSLMLPQSLITSRTRNRATKPSYNGVLVYGEHSTSLGGLIKRTGSSGSYRPSMVTGDLITDQAVAIARGKAVLSDTGDIGNIGVSMPLHQDFGVIKPSTLIGVNDGEQWVGMVRGTTISGKLSSNQALQIEQSVSVERHFDKEGA